MSTLLKNSSKMRKWKQTTNLRIVAFWTFFWNLPIWCLFSLDLVAFWNYFLTGWTHSYRLFYCSSASLDHWFINQISHFLLLHRQKKTFVFDHTPSKNSNFGWPPIWLFSPTGLLKFGPDLKANQLIWMTYLYLFFLCNREGRFMTEAYNWLCYI